MGDRNPLADYVRGSDTGSNSQKISSIMYHAHIQPKKQTKKINLWHDYIGIHARSSFHPDFRIVGKREGTGSCTCSAGIPSRRTSSGSLGNGSRSVAGEEQSISTGRSFEFGPAVLGFVPSPAFVRACVTT